MAQSGRQSLELANAKDSTPPESGVIRHFDRSGKMLGSFIPRSTFSSPLMVLYGMLRSARGRIGWYTGPNFGPGSQYYEILSDGTVRKYPAISLNGSETVNGLGLTDDGRTYLTTSDNSSGTRPGQSWIDQIWARCLRLEFPDGVRPAQRPLIFFENRLGGLELRGSSALSVAATAGVGMVMRATRKAPASSHHRSVAPAARSDDHART